ncbi:protein ANTAGONIST OF LIKE HETEROCHROMATIN PROTEIN 1-like [Harmonia axyridis]|uniref:protein ANTAGONIST OF LIKE HETEROCHROMATIN PROTEIN 1-like n=1 Tax=Harmonia axyridis TaxID=115357 RepID=UPI001E2751CC|nr:protein ANTAGONIST OF LIKE HETEROCHROMATIN PROTEIN 1-like [Harmonia axyridis]
MDDHRKKIVFAYLVYKKYICKQNRRYWVHPYTDLRLLRGRFHTSFGALRENPDKFYNYYRMSVKSFDELAAKITPKIRSQDTWMRLSIPPLEMLAVTLRYLGSGCDQIDLHLTYRLGHTTIGKILRKVCMAIWECLLPESFPEFTEERWKTVADGFQQYCQFPNCLGAIDGKHVRLRKPKMSGSLFYNYKHFFSIVLLAIADSNYNFIYIDVGDFGKESDSTIFQRSSFNRKLEENTLNIPRPQPLPGTATRMPYTFIGDEAFSLSPNSMRPFSGKVLSEKKRIFNYRLSRARRNVESTFGILSNK